MASEIERTDTTPVTVASRIKAALNGVDPKQLSEPGQIEALYAKAFPVEVMPHEFRRAALSLLEKASKPS